MKEGFSASDYRQSKSFSEKANAPRNAEFVNKLSLKDQDGVHKNIVHNQVNQVNVKEEAIDYFLKLAKEEVNVQDVPSLPSMEQMKRSSQVIIFFKGHSMVTFHIFNFLTFSTFSRSQLFSLKLFSIEIPPWTFPNTPHTPSCRCSNFNSCRRGYLKRSFWGGGFELEQFYLKITRQCRVIFDKCCHIISSAEGYL